MASAVPEPRNSPPAARIRVLEPVSRAAADVSADLVPDPELIAAMVAGEPEALGVLYDRHANVVFALLTRILGDREGAEDLLQEVFLRAWQQARTYDEARGAVRCWLNGIAHNLALNEVRRRGRRPRIWRRAGGEEDGSDAYIACIDPAPGPDSHACSRVRDVGMAQALEQLPRAQRDVLALYAAGFSQSEIAAKLGEPLGTVKSRMRRALCQLRESLPAYGVDAEWPDD
ncbi:MAG: sigma-70 family RNA polymerase sigma factor [Thermomicrobiales bacterium]|nr:sigma-70 family RNA polymerase sigma factor [Thermomicrobiales bacterium]